MFKFAFIVGCVLCSCLASAARQGSTAPHAGNKTQVQEFVASFVQAFDNLDFPKFRDCFAEDASVFYPEFFPRRVEGERQLNESWRKVFDNIRAQSGKSKAPYMNLMPVDIQMQMLPNVAIVTFHLEHAGTAVGRRTLVLRKSSRGWQIVHLHASNVDFGQSGR